MKLKFNESTTEEEIIEAITIARTDARIHTLAFDEIDITPDIAASLVGLFQHAARSGRDFDRLSLEFCTGYVDLVCLSALTTDSIGHLFLAFDSPNDELIGRLATILRVSTSIQSLSLLIPFTEPTASHLADAIRENKSLEKLSISGSNFDALDDDNDDDNEETEVKTTNSGRRVRADSASVSLDTSDFAAFSPTDAALALAEGLRDNVTLSTLDLSCCYLPDEPLSILVSALAGHPNLQVLNLARNYCRGQTMHALGEVVGNEYSKITSLDINEQSSDETPMETPLEIVPLANAIQNNISLESIKLSHNRLDDKQLVHLVDCLQGNETLQELDLQYNTISDQGLEYMTSKLDGIKSLSVLLLGGNEFSAKGQHQLEALHEKEPDVCTIERPQGRTKKGKKGGGMLAGLAGLMGGGAGSKVGKR
jgi:Leucine Rich repeat